MLGAEALSLNWGSNYHHCQVSVRTWDGACEQEWLGYEVWPALCRALASYLGSRLTEALRPEGVVALWEVMGSFARSHRCLQDKTRHP
jgi:hypothetical protein